MYDLIVTQRKLLESIIVSEIRQKPKWTFDFVNMKLISSISNTARIFAINLSYCYFNDT